MSATEDLEEECRQSMETIAAERERAEAAEAKLEVARKGLEWPRNRALSAAEAPLVTIQGLRHELQAAGEHARDTLAQIAVEAK